MTLTVVCDRFLGLGRYYIVEVDGREIDRMGLRRKHVTTEVAPGVHHVVVRFAWTRRPESMPPAELDVTIDQSTPNVLLKLEFTAAGLAALYWSYREARRQVPRGHIRMYLALVDDGLT